MGDSVTKADLDDFRSFLLEQLDDHKSQLAGQFVVTTGTAETALCISKQLKADSDIKFTHPGNERNFKFNVSVKGILEKAIAALNSEDNNTTKELLNEASSLIDERNRKIRIADSSEAGWLTVKHYEASAVALDPDDDKKIHQAEKEALRQKSKAAKSKRGHGFPFSHEARGRGYPSSSYGRSSATYDRHSYGFSPFHPYQSSSSGQLRGSCRFCGAHCHWWRECPVRLARSNPNFYVGTSAAPSATNTLATTRAGHKCPTNRGDLKHPVDSDYAMM
ncbi:hypothetical protein QZH41_002076 [Actinostola sp. cb2023]|nr:hypothetical protein QZH41_002076 [Actinostola sp. cb2023]